LKARTGSAGVSSIVDPREEEEEEEWNDERVDMDLEAAVVDVDVDEEDEEDTAGVWGVNSAESRRGFPSNPRR
jgi:hypothetical protein